MSKEKKTKFIFERLMDDAEEKIRAGEELPLDNYCNDTGSSKPDLIC